MLDAYAVRKAIPRIVLAVIGINLSIYLCVALVDATNVVGGGLARLLVGPFQNADATVFDVPTDPTNAIVGGVGVYLAAGPLTAAVGSMFTTVVFGGLPAILSALGSLLFLLIPIGLLALAIIVTVVIRQALLFFLIVVSPVAVACYVLPGTEKYFKAWFDLFSKTLIVYPIIALMFALSDVFGSIIFTSNTGGLQGVAKIITGIIVIYAPLFLIPFAFKFAGGALGKIGALASGLGDKAGKSGFIKDRVDYRKQKLKDQNLQSRVAAYRKASTAADTHGGLRGYYAGRRAKGLSGYKADILDREAELTKRDMEKRDATKNYGDDSLIRAYTVNKDLADRQRAAGQGEGTLWRYATDAQGNRTGGVEYQSAGGSWQNETSVNEAQRKYGRKNVSQYQQSLSYEMQKANTQAQQDNLVRSFGETADEWGMDSNQANGAWIGAGFANQDKNLQWKHARWDNNDGSFKTSAMGENLLTEVDEAKGSYEAGRYNADTWTTMSRTVADTGAAKMAADDTVAKLSAKTTRTADEDRQLAAAQADSVKHDATLQRAARIVDSIRTEHPEVIDGKPTGKMITSIGAGASGRTKEEMTAFAGITDQFAGKYVAPEGFFPPGTSPPNRPQGQVEDALNDTDAGRQSRTR